MKLSKFFILGFAIIFILAFLASCGCSIYPPPTPVESTPSTTQPITPPNHTHTIVVDAAVAATCTETGLSEGKHCSTCNAVLVAQETVAAMGHSAEVIPAVPATCTATGLSEGSKCGVCGEVLTAQVEVPAMGHTEEVVPAVNASCTETGFTEGKRCSVCGEVIVAQTEIEKLAHTEVIDEAVPATLDATGLTAGKHCSVCNTVLVPQDIIPKLTPPPPTAKYPYAELVSRSTDAVGWITVRYNIWESKTECRTFAYKFLNEGIGAVYTSNTGKLSAAVYVPMMVLEDSGHGCFIEHYKNGNYVGILEQHTVFDNRMGDYNEPGKYVKNNGPYGVFTTEMPNVGETGTFDVKLILFESELDQRLNLVRMMDLWETITIKRYPCETFTDWVAIAQPFQDAHCS